MGRGRRHPLRSDEWEREHYKPAGAVRAHAWPVLVQQCGWAKVRKGALILTESGKDILQQFTPDKLRAGVNLGIGDDKFDELNRIHHIRGQSGKAKRWMTDPSFRKGAIVDAMEKYAPGSWIPFAFA